MRPNISFSEFPTIMYIRETNPFLEITNLPNRQPFHFARFQVVSGNIQDVLHHQALDGKMRVFFFSGLLQPGLRMEADGKGKLS